MTTGGLSAMSRLAVTAGASATIVLIERFVPLPFVRESALRALGSDVEVVSVGALGITPILAAWVLVELAAVIYGPWSALRSTPEGRVRLRSRAYALAALFALVQSAMITVALVRIRMADGPVLTSTGVGTLFGVALTLMGGAAVYLAIAELVDRSGLGNGIALLAGTGLVARLWPQGALHLQGMNPPAALALAGAALAAAAWLLARRRNPDLVPVWPLSRPYELEPAIAVLAREGITAFPRNARWYGLMPVLAAYAPVTLLVSASEAERASAKLRAVFAAD